MVSQHTCRACGGNSECAAINAAKPVCGPTGACLGCVADGDCKATPTTAICDREGGWCRKCASSSECVAIDPGKPVCTPSGLCVECDADRDCKGVTKPVCDLGAHTCRECRADSECPADPGVCLAHIDGHCAVGTETIYVQEDGTACNDKALPPPAMGATKDVPACSLQGGLALLSESRPLVVVRGPVSAGPAPVIAAAEMFVYSIIGQKDAVITTHSTAFTLRSGAVYLRGMRFSSPSGNALTATGGTLRLDGVTIDRCLKGGILLDGAAFDIRNTTVINNGPGSDVGGSVLGGILVHTLLNSGPKALNNVTVRNNAPYDLSCAGPIMGIGILAPGGAEGNCAVSTCATAGPTCGAQ
jgi:hypothetical protein